MSETVTRRDPVPGRAHPRITFSQGFLLLGKVTQSLELDPNVKTVYTIGSGAGCDLQVTHDTVSEVHAVLFISHGQWWISDVSSGNGVKVNNQPANTLVMNRSYISHGDRIMLSREVSITVQ